MLIVSITGIAGVISMAISFLILLMRLETDVNERLVVLLSMMLPVVIGLLLFWILFIISAIYMRKSYNSMGKRLNVNMFITSKINLIGSISSIILIGFLLFFIAQVLQIVTFFSIPDEIPEPQ